MKNFMDKLSNDIPTVEFITQSLNETFIEMDKEAPAEFGNSGGSTASVITKIGQNIYFANAGDSTSFLASFERLTGKTTIIHQNRHDKPNLPDEQARIERMGGKIHVPPKFPANSRVIGKNPVNNAVWSLGMSRSIGDWYFTGVIAEPIINVINIETLKERHLDELFVVSSSDGLYDHRQPFFVATRFASTFSGKNNMHIMEQCKNVFDLSTPKQENRYRDDITVMSLRFSI